MNMNSSYIKEGERLDDLQLGGLFLIQNPKWFCFGVDAVLLSDFAAKAVKKDARVLDLCTGNGIIPILLSAKTSALSIHGVEIQEKVAEMAQRSIKLNGLEEKIEIAADDLKCAAARFGKGCFDCITCNPPYKEAFGGMKNAEDTVTAARHEIFCTLEDVISVSGQLLRSGGKLCLIHRPERLVEIICLMRKYGIEPKRLRFVHPYPSKTATMVLAEGARGGRPKLHLEPPLYVHDGSGNYTEEINRIYGRI